MKKFYFIFAIILCVTSLQANANSNLSNLLSSNDGEVSLGVISGNFSICLPGPNTTQLSASLPPAPITATTPWFSLNPAVATISSTGLVTAVSFGATTISYTDSLGNVYSENVYVSSFPTITAPNGTSTCEFGNLQLEGSLFPNPVTPWESLNPNIATVDNTGLVTGVSAGVANILYRNLGGCTTTIAITINPSLIPIVTCNSTTLTSVTFNWTAVLGALTYVRSYTINGGSFISGGSGALLSYTVSGLSPGDVVELFVAPSGTVGSCFQVGSSSCAASDCLSAGIDGGTTICETSTAPINLFSLISGEVAGGTWTRSSGSGGIFNGPEATYTPTPGSTTSTFTYTLPGISPCPNDTSIATVNINIQPNAGLDGSTSICDLSVATINLFSIITGEQTGGIWNRISGTGGTFNALSGTFTPALGATTSLFSYSIAGVSPCVNDTSVATITISTQPNGVILSGNQSICVGSSTTFTATVAGGSWSSSNNAIATVNSLTGVITAISTGVATISYAVVSAVPCNNGTFTRTITVNQLIQATIDGFQGVCLGSTAVFSGSPAGGVWTSSNSAIASVDAAGFILGNAVGTATITYTVNGAGGCSSSSASRTLTVSSVPTLQLNSSPSTISQSVCINTAIAPILYSITDFDGVNVTTVGLPSGVSGSLNLGSYSITGTPLSPGTFQYTIIASGPCGSDLVSGTIVVSPNSALFLISAPYTADQSICLNAAIDPITYFTTSGVTGATVVGLPAGFSGSFSSGELIISGTSTNLEGVFPYTVNTSGGCGVESLLGTITVGQQVSTSFFCDPSQATSPESVFIYWNDVSGSTNYEFTYSINGGPAISDSTINPFYEIFNVLPGQSVLFTLTNAEGVSCFQSASTDCGSLTNESFESQVFQSFPNPVENVVNFKSYQPISSIQIFNLLGQEVYSQKCNEVELQINLSHLSSGNYLVKAQSNDLTKTFKIVKK